MKWGDWIRTRAASLGIATKKELAKRCGVTQKIVANWYAADLPLRIRASSFDALASVLETHPDVIHFRYDEYDPASAPSRDAYDGGQLFKLAPNEMLNLAQQAGYTELANELRDSLRHGVIESCLELLSGDALKLVYDLCRKLASDALAKEIDPTDLRGEAKQFNAKLEQQRNAIISQVEKQIRPK